MGVPVLVLVLATASAAAAARSPVVPLTVQARIARGAPGLAYAPTRMASGFLYLSWRKTPSAVWIRFRNKARWEIGFTASRLTGDCRVGMEKSFQLDGNKVYWSHSGARQQAWRCVPGPNGEPVRLSASSTQPPTRFADVGLGLVVASGKRIAV